MRFECQGPDSADTWQVFNIRAGFQYMMAVFIRYYPSVCVCVCDADRNGPEKQGSHRQNRKRTFGEGVIIQM